MRRVFLALAVLALVGSGAWAAPMNPAAADSSNLGGGVLIAHHPAAMQYSTEAPPEGWCEKYLNEQALTVCNDQVNRIDITTNGVFWFVLAAWNDPKKWCGAEFGLGGYDDTGFVVVANASCGTGFTPLEIASGGWPGPNSGIALAATEGKTWKGNLTPIYYFAGYVYSATTIPLAANPTTSFAGTANCQTPPVAVPADCLGAMGILGDGMKCCPPPPGDIPGACCFGGGVCTLVKQSECDAAGGVWNGAAACDPNPCPVTWACCVHDEQSGEETCIMLTSLDCVNSGGTWKQNQDCATYACPLIRACCIDGICQLTTQDYCVNTLQGQWQSGKPSCDPGTEPCPTPVEGTSWGMIKSIYR